jgi:hypothetical protein
MLQVYSQAGCTCRIVDSYGRAADGGRRALHLNPVDIAGRRQVLIYHELIGTSGSTDRIVVIVSDSQT